MGTLLRLQACPVSRGFNAPVDSEVTHNDSHCIFEGGDGGRGRRKVSLCPLHLRYVFLPLHPVALEQACRVVEEEPWDLLARHHDVPGLEGVDQGRTVIN